MENVPPEFEEEVPTPDADVAVEGVAVQDDAETMDTVLLAIVDVAFAEDFDFVRAGFDFTTSASTFTTRATPADAAVLAVRAGVAGAGAAAPAVGAGASLTGLSRAFCS